MSSNNFNALLNNSGSSTIQDISQVDIYNNYRRFIFIVSILYFGLKLWYNVVFNILNINQCAFSIKNETQEMNDYVLALILSSIIYITTNMYKYNSYTFLMGIAVGAQLPIIIKVIDQKRDNLDDADNKKHVNLMKYAMFSVVIAIILILNVSFAPDKRSKILYPIYLVVILFLIMVLITVKQKSQRIVYDTTFVLWIVSLLLIYNDPANVIETIHGIIFGAFIGNLTLKGIKYFLTKDKRYDPDQAKAAQYANEAAENAVIATNKAASIIDPNTIDIISAPDDNGNETNPLLLTQEAAKNAAKAAKNAAAVLGIFTNIDTVSIETLQCPPVTDTDTCNFNTASENIISALGNTEKRFDEIKDKLNTNKWIQGILVLIITIVVTLYVLLLNNYK
jgi:hypothetical protein